MKASTIGQFIAISGILIIIVVGYKKCLKDKKIIKHAAFTNAYIKDVKPGAKWNWTVFYEYEVNGIKYSHDRNFDQFKVDKTQIIYKNMPLIYDSLDPANSELLITKYYFKYFYTPIPDSMQWVK